MSRAPRVKVVPFWVLQASELLVMVALVDLSLHVARGAVLVGAGAAFAAAALTADGPLGVVRLCGRRLHVRVVTVLAVVVAVTPAVPQLRPDLTGIVVLAFAAVGVVRLASLTSTQPGVAGGRPGSGGGPSGGDPEAGADPGPPAPAHLGDPAPGPGTIGSFARLVGRSAATASAAAGRHRPVVIAGTRRSVRAAGRATARARARSGRPASGVPPEGGGPGA